MSEEDAEIALLHQLQAGQESGSWEDEGANGAEVGGLPSNIEHNNEDVKRETVADDQVLSRALSPTGAGAVSDGGASSVSLPAIAIAGDEASRSSSRASSRKQKTVGGFIADDSDEEYDVTTPQTGLQPAAINTPNRTISPSPLQNSVSQQDLQTAPENQGDSMATQPAKSLPVNPSAVGVPSVPAPATQVLTSAGPSVPGANIPKARLPHDRTGILEDRIKEDPRGDLDAWLSLISEHRKRNKLDEARAVYDRFFNVFPQAAEVWVAYIEMELESDNFTAAETLFGRCLLTVPNVQLWSVYLNYIRRRNDLTNDVSGSARSTISQSYDFVLANIGIDKDSGRIWQEFIQFVRNGPGQVGGNSWQDQLKMDQLRKAYQRAINVPMSALNGLWKEYDQFELSLNKMTGRKFLQEKSPGYMSARGANNELEKKLGKLVRTTLPKLPPMYGFEGDDDYMLQVRLWKEWIQWEKADPLTLIKDDLPLYRQRVVYLYKQALMALRFWPEMWIDAAEWCFENGLTMEGDTFLKDGIAANPESSLLAFKQADRLESNLLADDGLVEKGATVRAPFDKLLDALYDMIKQLKVREAREMAKLEESLAVDATISAIIGKIDEDDEEDENAKKARERNKALQTKNIQAVYLMQSELISRTISFAWIAMMRAMRRVQGKGSPKESVGGSRKVFADARARGKLTSDVYVAAALIEHTVYKDPAGTKIFERGAKLFPEDANFTLEYLKHLLSIGDITNARVTFETVVGRLTQKADKEDDKEAGNKIRDKTKPLYSYFHKYESQYGDLSQINKLEQRMSELWPEDPKLSRFSARYSSEGFDPTAVRLVISPPTQMRPKLPQVMQSIEQQPSIPEHNSPRPQYVQEASPRPQPPPQFLQPASINSPKRPFPIEDSDNELNRPRKLARGESPLKGAAGRRLDQQKRLQQGTPSWNAAPFVVPRDITFLLSIIPRPEDYKATKFKPDALVRLLRETIVPDYSTWKSAAAEQQQSAVPQQQRYDGMSSQNYTQQRPGPIPGGNQYQSYQGGATAPYQNPNQADPYGGGPGMMNHQRDVYSRPPVVQHGLPPRPQLQGQGGSWAGGAGGYQGVDQIQQQQQQQQMAPVDESGTGSAGGYNGGVAGGPPQLQAANNWYYRG